MKDLTLSRPLDRALVGIKGPHAAQWLQTQGITIPERANSWVPGIAESDVTVRLGHSEFLIDQASNGNRSTNFADVANYNVEGAYPVLREDACFELSGADVHEVLHQVCSFNFADVPFDERHAVMTMMIGVAVTVVPQGNAAQPRYRIWCDPSFGDYLGGSLQQIVNECSGGWREHQNSG